MRMRLRQRVRLLSVVALVTTCAVHASAQEAPTPEPAPAPPPSAANQTAGLQKFDEGRAALEAGDYQTALAAFDASNKLLASPNSLLYMARCYKGLGKVASAYTTYRLASRQAQDRLVATAEKRYAATRDAATREAAEIEPTVPKLAIRVPPLPPDGLHVKVNGVEVPASLWGTAVDTDPGHIVVEATGPRLTPFHAEVDLPHDVDPGPREVVVTAPGHTTFTWRGDLKDGDDTAVDVALVAEAPRGARKMPAWLFYTAGGAAIASVAVGAYFGLRANAAANEEEAKNPYARDPDRKDRIATQATVANVFFVTGAVLAAGTVVLAFTTNWRGTPAKTGQAGISVGVLGPMPSLAAEGRF
jgi:tetratricopeptide (TPR) repeat protein